jgi:hypothetical protein
MAFYAAWRAWPKGQSTDDLGQASPVAVDLVWLTPPAPRIGRDIGKLERFADRHERGCECGRKSKPWQPQPEEPWPWQWR